MSLFSLPSKNVSRIEQKFIPYPFSTIIKSYPTCPKCRQNNRIRLMQQATKLPHGRNGSLWECLDCEIVLIMPEQIVIITPEGMEWRL